MKRSKRVREIIASWIGYCLLLVPTIALVATLHTATFLVLAAVQHVPFDAGADWAHVWNDPAVWRGAAIGAFLVVAVKDNPKKGDDDAE